MGRCPHIDSSKLIDWPLVLVIAFFRCTAQVRLAYVLVDLLCRCAVHTVYVVRLCTAVLEPRTAASIIQAAGGSCIILTCSSPYRHDFTDGTAHYVSRCVFCSCFASLKTTSARFWRKRKRKKRLPSNRIPTPTSILATIAD